MVDTNLAVSTVMAVGKIFPNALGLTNMTSCPGWVGALWNMDVLVVTE